MRFVYIYSVFLDILDILNFMGKYFLKLEYLSFKGQNQTLSEIRDSHFVER